MPFDGTDYRQFRELAELREELKVLRQAYKQVQKPSRWTTGRYYRKPLFLLPYRACAIGHLALAAGYPAEELAMLRSNIFYDAPASVGRICTRHAIGSWEITTFNDNPNTTHKDVCEWFENIIKRTEQLIKQLEAATC